MPKLLEWKGWIFLYYSMEGDEPPHVHVRKDRKEAKFWLNEVRLARNRRCTDKDITDIISAVQEHREAFLEACMSILEIDDELLEPVGAFCTQTDLVVSLADGAQLVTPLWWYPKLLNAELGQRNELELSPFGIHWPTLDEDLSIEGMLKGRRAKDAVPPAQAAE